MLVHGVPNAKAVNSSLDYSTPAENYEGAFNTQFIARYGDVVIGHYSFSSAAKFAAWVDKWHVQWGWPRPRVIIQPHIHGASLLYDQGGHRVLVEAGFAGNPKIMNYAVAKHRVGARPPVPGYVEFKQVFNPITQDWETDISTVRFIHC
jgi:hypothetical protein